jgi:hypothetical protein
MSLVKKLLSVTASLRGVLAKQNTQLEAKLLEAGFPSLEEAVRCAKIYRELVDEYTKLCGPLIQETKVYDKIKEQLPKGEISFHFRNEKHLGRMRALVRLVCLRHGYYPLFTKVNGVPNFEISPQKPLDYDTYGTLYSIKVVPMDKPNARAFYSLDQQIRRQLLALAH